MAPRKYTDEQIIDAVARSKTLSEAARMLGTAPETVRKRAKRLGLDCTHHTTCSYSDDDLRSAVSQSLSYRETLFTLGLKESGGAYQGLKTKIASLEIDVSHFLGKSRQKGVSPPCKLPVSEIFVVREEGQPKLTRKTLHRAMTEVGVQEHCEQCGLGPVWNGKPITLQIDHRNGNNRDNLLGNLRFLCPNCHTQTATWGKVKPA